MAIDKNSPEFMFGQIIQRLHEGDKVMDEIKNQVQIISETIIKLPCSDNLRRISILETWKGKLNNNQVFKEQTSIKLKHAIIAGLIIAVFTSGMTFLFASLG